MATKTATSELQVDQRRKPRRMGERRKKPTEAYSGEERRSEDRRRSERRRQIDPTTCERDYRPDEVEFMKAMDDYKRRSGRPFPTWSEVLEVIRDLGYRKVAEPSQTFAGVEELAAAAT